MKLAASVFAGRSAKAADLEPPISQEILRKAASAEWPKAVLRHCKLLSRH
jgi:hypothetical protein